MIDFLTPLKGAEMILAAIVGVIAQYVFDKKLLPRYKLRHLSYILPLTVPGTDNVIRIRPSLQVIVSGKRKPSRRSYTHSCEVRALNKLYSTLHDLPAEPKTDYSESMQTTEGNWILLGLRHNNPLSKIVENDLTSRNDLALVVPEEDEPYFKYSDGTKKQVFKCEHNGDLVKKDYGIIYRKITDSGSIWFLCGGIHMYGTQAALELAFNPTFIRNVRKHRCNQFIQLVEAPVDQSGLALAGDTKWKDLPFIRAMAESG